jgi:hypothetical protein
MIPPINGPIDVPSEKVIMTIAMNLDLSRRGTRSQTTSSIKRPIPPPPIPWTERPAMSMLPDVAGPLIALPRMRRETAVIIGHRLPKISESWPKRGWTAMLECRIAYESYVQSLKGPEKGKE